MSADVERFMTHVKVLPDGCWEWTGSTNDQGYATFSIGGKSRRAFRWIIDQLREPVPDGYEPDHVCHSDDDTCAGGTHCRHRRCVNPNHGEAVTHAENSRRAAYRVSTCREGHLLPEVDEGRRVCRECANRRSREYKARRRAATARVSRPLPAHGRSRYTHHRCRCEVCCQAESAYQGARRERQRAMRMYDAIMGGAS